MKRILFLVVLGLIAAYFLGPQPEPLTVNFQLPDNFPTSIQQIENFIAEDNSIHNIRPDNESRVIWADSTGIKTEYSLVYLHGFSASPGEGNPIHEEISKQFGMNLIIPRLAQHGLVTNEPLLEFSAPEFINDAYQAIKLGELLGIKVIVMSCSTGGTASLYNLAHADVNVHAQVLYSPNIELYDSRAGLLTGPWGLQIARLVKGGQYHTWEVPAGAEKYWYGKYRLEATIELQNMLESFMTKNTFGKVNTPTMVGYYFKDEDHQDDVVSVSGIRKMVSELGTTKENLNEVVFTEVDAHALQSEYFSKDLDEVRRATVEFLEKVME